MSTNSFLMRPQKAGRMKYLILTIFPPIGLMYLVMNLMQNGLIPQIKALGMFSIYGSMAIMMVISYFLIWKKNHTIEVKDNTLTEKNWRSELSVKIKTSQISGYRRNFLGEIILVDANSKKLLCVESNMTNRDRFEQWLTAHNIESK